MPARAAVFILFFLSGAVALVYEVLWLRMLILIFGSTQFAVSTILTAFMSGLALGSFLFGRIADRSRGHVDGGLCADTRLGHAEPGRVRRGAQSADRPGRVVGRAAGLVTGRGAACDG